MMRIRNLVITAVLATAILCLSGVVNAQTADNSALIAQLQAQIQQLLQQIATLQAQQQGGGQAWCHTFNTYIVASNAGGEVGYLQTALMKQGLLSQDDINSDNGGANIEGPSDFGDATAAAVVKFQGKYGIMQTGTVGPKTRAMLNSKYGCSAKPSPQTCTPNWQCTDWSVCTNNQQSRTCTDLNNCGFTDTNTPGGAEPVKLQSCNLNYQCSNLYWIDNTTQNCATQKQFCGSYAYLGLQTFTDQLTCQIAVLQKQLNKTCNTNSDCLSGQVCNNGLCKTANQPMITSLGTNNALPGEKVAVYVSNLPTNASYAYGILFKGQTNSGDTNATILSDGSLGFTVPNLPAGNYQINVVVYGPGINSNSVPFTINTPATGPWITSISPSQGGSGTIVTITGSNFTGATSVGFYKPGHTEAVMTIPQRNLNVNANSITFTIDQAFDGMVDAGLYTITVVTPTGTAYTNSTQSFNHVLSTPQPSITITYPNGGETWNLGDNVNIAWNSTGLLPTDKINLWIHAYYSNLSSQNQDSEGMIVVNLPGNTTSYNWTVPSNFNAGVSLFKIHISVIRNTGSPEATTVADDYSNDYFSVVPKTVSPITIIYPTGPTQWAQGSTQKIVWIGGSYTNGIYPTTTISIWPTNYPCDSGNFKACLTAAMKTIVSTVISSGSAGYDWQVGKIQESSGLLVPGNYYMQICSGNTVYEQACKTIDTPFTIAAATPPCLSGAGPLLPGQVYCQKITVTSPNGGETWAVGEMHNITWNSTGLPFGANVSIGLNGDGQTSTMAGAQIASVPASGGSYSWTVPSTIGGESLAGKKYDVYVTYSGTPVVGDVSDNYFSVVAPTTSLNSTQNQLASIANAIAQILSQLR